MTSNTARLALLAMLAPACVSAPDEPEAPAPAPGEMEESTDDTEEPESCTAATDSLPLDTLYANLSTSAFDVVRDTDGTVYFISNHTRASATIGRRVPCGDFEKTWLEVSAPINDLAISTDRTLYMAGYEGGSKTENTAYVYALDLTRPDSIPVNLVREPEQIAGGLAAGPNGTMYFLQGWLSMGLRKVDAAGLSARLPLELGQVGMITSITAAADGTLLASGSCGVSACIARLDVSGTFPQVTATSNVPQKLYSLVASADGGYFAVREEPDPLFERALVHAPTMSSTVVSMSSGKRARYLFGVDSDPKVALEIVTTDETSPVRVVTLPVAPAM